MLESTHAGKRELRRHFRQRRRALPAAYRKQAAWQLGRHLRRLQFALKARRVAVYWPNDGEIDPLPAARSLPQAQLFLPVLHRANHREAMAFHRYYGNLAPNRYGIPEPRNATNCPAWMLDLVLIPLVAFDRQGNRLGMGGGYYDRCFAFVKNNTPSIRRPHLVGVSFACQEAATLPTDSWDIPLEGVITEHGYISGAVSKQAKRSAPQRPKTYFRKKR